MYYVICSGMAEFTNWRIENGFHPRNRYCMWLGTFDPRAAERLRSREIKADDVIVRYGDYDRGPYWHDIEDRLAMCAPGVDTGDPRQADSSN